MRADFVVVFEVGFENLAQLPFLEHDHSIQAFTSNRTHQALDVGVGVGCELHPMRIKRNNFSPSSTLFIRGAVSDLI